MSPGLAPRLTSDTSQKKVAESDYRSPTKSSISFQSNNSPPFLVVTKNIDLDFTQILKIQIIANQCLSLNLQIIFYFELSQSYSSFKIIFLSFGDDF